VSIKFGAEGLGLSPGRDTRPAETEEVCRADVTLLGADGG